MEVEEEQQLVDSGGLVLGGAGCWYQEVVSGRKRSRMHRKIYWLMWAFVAL